MKLGICHICGQKKELSFEHVPPAAAFNSRPILRTAFAKMLQTDDFDNLKGKTQQRGAGAHTLCERCNNTTGKWYGGAYASWAHQAMQILIAARGQPSLSYPFRLFPWGVLKQVICMFFSVNSSGFQKVQPDLVRFVLNPFSSEYPSTVRIFAFYTLSNRIRSAGAAAMLRGPGMHVFSEIAFAPFGFVMALSDTPPPDPRLVDIGGFAKFSYRDWRTGISMRLPMMSIYTGFPGDYRPREQTLAEAAVSKAQGDLLR
jgi:hypothetical protein